MRLKSMSSVKVAYGIEEFDKILVTKCGSFGGY